MRTTVLGVLGLVLVAGCTSAPGPTESPPIASPSSSAPTALDASPSASIAPSPTGLPSPTPTEAPSVRPMLLGTVQIDADDITAEPSGATETQTHADGSLRLRARIPSGATRTRLELHLAPDTVETRANGGMAVISNSDGQALAGVPRPSARDAAGQPVPTQMSVIDTVLAFLVTPEARHEGEIVVDVWVGYRMVDGVAVGEHVADRVLEH